MSDNDIEFGAEEAPAPRELRPNRGKTSKARNADNPRASMRRSRDERESRQTEVESTGMLRSFGNFDVLPALPQDHPDWHFCWLSTTNKQDSIHRRMQMGYVPVKPDDPALEGHSVDLNDYSLKSGEWPGIVGINEMLAFKVERHRYEEWMQHFHHNQPLQDEEAIREGALSIADTVTRAGGKVLIEEGSDGLGSDEPTSMQPILQRRGRGPKW